jgi:thiamine-phosphate pyrophosphorylase
MKSLSHCRLYAFVDTAYLSGRRPADLAEQLCAGGADLIQLRAKEAPSSEILQIAQSILPITRQAGVGLVINDFPSLAAQTGAEYCHLGQEDFFDAGYTKVAEVRPGDAPSPPREERAGERMPDHPLALATETSSSAQAPPADSRAAKSFGIGLSTHSPEQAQRAIEAGADYIAIGPVYATGTKPTAKPVTLDYVRWAAENVKVPWFAIGGINLQNLDEVLAAGARRVCVVSAIMNAPNVVEACRRFKERLDGLLV